MMTEEQLAKLKADHPVVHVTPSYPPGCKHEWNYGIAYNDPPGSEPVSTDEPTTCKLCGMSWTRYIFMECP